ncbi:MAG: tetratricopeptide repeat protein, partial [Holophagales bacterium]|nr:tetratricopeptide repeat protein [Holophagales bacterium]
LAEAFGELGMLYLHYGFHDAAVPSFTNAQSLAPGEVRWAYYRAVGEEAVGDLQGAAASLRQVLSVREGNLPAVLRLADILVELGELDEARFLYDAALQAPLGQPAGHAGLGRIALESGRPAEAVEHLEKALEAQPQATALRYQLGLAYRDTGSVEKAKELLADGGGEKVRYPDPLMIQLGLRFDDAGTAATRAGQAARRGDLDQAIEGYRQTLAQTPGDLRTRRSLAQALIETGDAEGAARELREILRQDPENASALVELGSLRLGAGGQASEGIEMLEKAVELAPDFREARLRLARALAGTGRLADGLPHMAKAVELDPRDMETRLMLARGHLGTGDPRAALEAVEALLGQEPGNLGALILRGRIHGALEDPESAEADFRRVTSLSTADPGVRAAAFFQLALLRQAQQRIPESVELYRQAVALDPEHRQSLFNLAVILSSNGRLDDAVDLYQRLFDLDPDNDDYRYRLAVTLMARKDLWPALGHFEALHQAHPQMVEFIISSSVLMAELGQGDQAAERLAQAITEIPEALPKAQLMSVLGGIEIGNGNRQRGLGHLRRAVETAPSSPDARQAYAQALASDGRYSEAAEQYEAYLDLAPGDTQGWFAYAMALILSDRWTDVKSALTEVTAGSTDVALTHLYARVLAAAPEASVRDGERAVNVARAVFEAERNPAHGETLAMAMAAAGRFEEAVQLQERLLAEAERAQFDPGFVDRVRRNLERYRQGQVGVADW